MHIPQHTSPYLHMHGLPLPMAQPQRIHTRKQSPPDTQIKDMFSREIYDTCLRQLTNCKLPSLVDIPNDIPKTMPPTFHNLLYHVFKYCCHTRQIPNFWKYTHTILLHKKRDHTLLPNFKPISIANTIYKLFTNTTTTLLQQHGETYQIFNNIQEVFREN